MSQELLQMDERLDALAPRLAAASCREREVFFRQLHESWVYHELHLEGIPVDADRLKRALGRGTGCDACEEALLQRVRSQDMAVRSARAMARRVDPIELDDLLRLHAVLLDDEGSPWRTDEGPTEAYKHNVAPAALVRAEAAEAFAQLHRTYYREHPIDLAVQLHYDLTQVWPFTLASAATARLAANTVLLHHGYPPLIVRAQERHPYYHALHYDIRRLRELMVAAYDEQLRLRERTFRQALVEPHRLLRAS